ncbi:MAG: hypothetical protein CW338_05915 [Clostridiales bacterium]|nr:hypothetical protein [Clostridiales bacterium]
MDAYLLSHIQHTIDKLSVRITVLDRNGRSLIPDDGITYTVASWPGAGEYLSQDGRVYFSCTSVPDLILMVTGEDSPRLRDMLCLADSFIAALSDADSAGNDIQGAYRKLLQNDLSPTEIETLTDEFAIDPSFARSVLLFYFPQIADHDAADILNEYLPVSERDVVVSIDRHTAALLKDVSAVEEIDELKQYAYAAREEVMEDIALPMTVGIGDVAADAHALHQSYRQSRRAIEIGRIFKNQESVYLYSSMLIERFLSGLSAETAEHYHNLLFNENTDKLFNAEMLSTIDMFFKKDLNLSDTARQLYIHRNTLVYRLDKVQRQIGLNLRKFEDAVTFKLLMEMEKCKDNLMIEK